MEVEYTKCFIPEIEREKDSLTIFKHRQETQPIIKDGEGNIITHAEWYCLAYRPISMTRYEDKLFEEWEDSSDVDYYDYAVTY